MQGLDRLASRFLENQDMQSIIEVFAENILLNLIYSKGKIVDQSLQVFQFYSSMAVSCRMLASTSMMERIISDGSQKYSIL